MKLLILAIFFIALSPTENEQVYTINQEAIASLDVKAVLPYRTTAPMPIVSTLSQDLRSQRYKAESIKHWWDNCHLKVSDWYSELHGAIAKDEGIQHIDFRIPAANID